MGARIEGQTIEMKQSFDTWGDVRRKNDLGFPRPQERDS